MKTFLKTFLRDESGASAAEYALILAVVGVLIGGAALGLGQQVQEAIETSATEVDACNDGDASCVAFDPDAP